MAVDYSEFRVELRRHIGQMSTELGIVNVEHPQKIVLVYPPASAVVPGSPSCRQAGYLAASHSECVSGKSWDGTRPNGIGIAS